MIKLVLKQASVTLLLLWLAGCGSSNSSLSLGTITVNGPGITGTVPAGQVRVFTMQSIGQGLPYIIQTTIPVTSLANGSVVTDGTFTVNIYSSESAYTDNLPPEPLTVVSTANNPGTYEATFTATTTNNYVAVVQGDSSSTPGQQFFYDLRIMSADPVYLTAFAAPPSILAANYAIYFDYLQVFNGGNVTPSGTYSLNLVSTTTTTGYYPQVYVYNNATLETSTLLYSAYTTSTEFVVTDFTTTPPTTLPFNPNDTTVNGVTITGIPFTSSGPYIVVRGIGPGFVNGFVNYTMIVSP